MIERFEIQPARIVWQWILMIHSICAVVVCLFAVSLLIKGLLLAFLMVSLVWQIKHRCSHKLLIEYNSGQNHWRIMNKDYIWNDMVSIQPVYVNTKFIWLNFFGQQRAFVSVIVGADSLDEAKYLQLRRSVICPAALNADSS